MRRKTDMIKDNDEQQSTSRMSPNLIKMDSQNNSNRDLYENQMNDNDPLTHDTILPHRKRIRKDTLQYIQSQQLSTSDQIVDVSLILFILINSISLEK
jgi:hypothetical protein